MKKGVIFLCVLFITVVLYLVWTYSNESSDSGSWGKCVNGIQTRKIANKTEQRKCGEDNKCVVKWSEWSECSQPCGTGHSTRKGVVTRKGTDCPSLTETRDCKIKDCAPECELGEWSEWSECTVKCGKGSHTRTRINKNCNDVLTTESKECQGEVCPIDCVVSEWSSWGSCDKQCGSGSQTRSRQITTQSSNGGAVCPPLTESKTCQGNACPVDCVVSEWSSWGSCDKQCGSGSQTRSRQITTQPANGGAVCPPLTESKTCQGNACPVDCRTGPWSEWGNCDKTCGGGSQTRSRQITTQSSNGGAVCPPLTESKTCNTQACPPDCIIGPWSAWSECTAPCNGGSQSRTRVIQNCDDTVSKVERRECNTQACPPPPPPVTLPCTLTNNYGPWSECNRTCGGGIQTRSAIFLNNNGKCGTPPIQTRQCNNQPCENTVPKVDCVLSDWGEWGKCGYNCTQSRGKTVITPASGGGLECPTTNLTQSRACYEQDFCKCSLKGTQSYTNGLCKCKTGFTGSKCDKRSGFV